MDNLIRLLDRKNLCFRSFQKLCHEFVDEIARGEVSNLEQFQRKREGIIKVLEHLESEIGVELGNLARPGAGEATELPKETRLKVEAMFRERDGLVKSILSLDLEIMGHIDRIKNDTIRRLQTLQSGRRTVSAYRSPLESVEAAEGGTKIVDHEA